MKAAMLLFVANSIHMLTADSFLGGKLCILRKGKKSYATVRVAGV